MLYVANPHLEKTEKWWINDLRKQNRFKKRTNKHQIHDTNILEIFKVNLIKV